MAGGRTPAGRHVVPRAAVIRGSDAVDLVEVSAPDPGPGEVSVRLEGCGVAQGAGVLGDEPDLLGERHRGPLGVGIVPRDEHRGRL